MNKKRLGKFIAVSSVFVMSTVTGAIISGCSSGGGKHEHNLSEISAVEPTCTTDGRSAYYVCDGCELVFADAEGKTEIDVAETVKPKLNHNLEHHDADPATCTKLGNIEYWECTRGDGIFSDAEGKTPVETVETTKDHDWGETGHHEQVDPTTESEGLKEYWHCSECNLDYSDEYGDKKVTLEELKIDKVSENIDGQLTADFYPTDNALTIGGIDVKDGGKGLVINAKRATDGVYLHIVVNYDVEATKQPAGRGKIGLYFNVRNTDSLNLPGGAGVCLEKAMLMELYLTGKVEYHQPYFLMDFEKKTNEEGSKTKYTNTWEMFIPHSGFAEVNDGVFDEAFETVEGKTALKAGYTYLLTAIGAMDATETFEANGESKCDIKDENTWAFWTNQGHGDWGSDQKYYVLGAEGITSDFQRATDTYAVEVNDYSNATVTGLTETVDYDKELTGIVTVDEGYRLSGIKVNGQVFKFEKAADANTYDYRIAVSELTNVKWNDAVLTVEVVVTKLDYQTVTATLQGVAGGKTQNIANGTDVVIVSEFGDEYTATVGADGEATFNEVLCQEYFVKIADYVDGSLTVINGDSSAQATLQYRFAHNAGDRGDLVDLTDMNNANASITLGAQNVNGVDQNVISVQLNLSEEMKNAGAYVLYTTVTVNGDVSASKQNTWLQRFGIRFAAGDVNNTYNNKFVIWWDDLGLNSNPSAIWANDATSCGGGGDRRATFDWLASSVQDGLQLKVVRNGGYVSISAYNLDDGQWYTLLSGTTSATAENDITFYVSGESFTFSEISFEKLNVVSLKLPSGNTDGIKGHLTSSKGDVFTLSGILTSEDELSIPAGSIAYTEYDNVEIENDLGLITIAGNGIADRNTHSYNHATYILPEAVRGEKEISLSFNIKDINESQETDAWAARRFGIQIGKGAYGLYFWTPNGDEFNIIKLVEGTLDMNTDREGMDIAKANWAAPIIRSSDGLDVQIVRIGKKIVVNLKNSDGAWVRIGEMDCPESVETEIKFVGGGDTWEVSAIAARKVQAVSAKDATTTAAGNIAHYTDGTNYYLTDGTVTTAEAVVIPQIVEQTVEISVEVYGTDGNKIANADLSNVKVSLIGEYDYNKAIYTDLAVMDGKLVLEDGKIYAGTYSVSVANYAVDAIEIGKDTATLTLKLYQIAGYQITEATKTNKPQSVTTGFNENGVTVKLVGCKTDDWAEYNNPVPEATLTLPAQLANNKNVSVEFNLKLSNQGFWGANAFGVSVVKGYNGFILRTFGSDASEIDVSQLYMQALCEDHMKFLGKNSWVKGLSLTENGVNIRVIRVTDTLTLYAQKDGTWEKLFSVSCAADAETEIKFMGAASDFEVSNIVVTTAPAAFTNPDGYVKVSGEIEYHEYVAPTVQADGRNAYYSVGDVLYTVNGEKTTLEQLAIAKLTATEITLTVKGHKDGAETLLNGTVTATGEYETSFNGTLANGAATVNVYEVTYTISVEGYIAKEFTVVAGTTTYDIVLEYDFAQATCKAEQVDLSKMNEANHEIKLTGTKADWDDYNNPVPEATLTLPAQLANNKNVSVEFNLKLSNQGFWGTNAFGVSVVKGYNGFILRTFGSDASEIDVSQLYKQALCEDHMKFLGKNSWLKGLSLTENGVNIRVIRVTDTLTLYAQKDGTWEKLFSVSCAADAETEIKFMGAAADFTVSNIVVGEYTPKTISVTKGETSSDITLTIGDTLTEGSSLTGSISTTGSHTEFAIQVNGKTVKVVESGEFTIEWSKLGIINETQITVTVYTTETTATGSNKVCPTGNTNLDGDTLDGKAILDYARYQNGGVKHKGAVVGTEMDNHGRYGNDYDGSTTGTTFTVEDNTNGDSAYLNPNQYYDITLHIKKGTTMIRLYTGTYQNTGDLYYMLSENGIKLISHTLAASDRSNRTYIVDIAIDTSSWREDETRDMVLRVGGNTDCELAAIVVLGDTVTPSPAE